MDPRLLTGTLDLLVLDVLSRGESYGYQIAQTVLAATRGEMDLKEGSLYPALHRLERQRWVAARWADGPEGRRRKYYRLTPLGKTALEDKRSEWDRFATGVQRILGQTPNSAATRGGSDVALG